MPDLFDYLIWRGDLTLEQSPFNDVDSLILCSLSYAALDGLVGPGGATIRPGGGGLCPRGRAVAQGAPGRRHGILGRCPGACWNSWRGRPGLVPCGSLIR